MLVYIVKQENDTLSEFRKAERKINEADGVKMGFGNNEEAAQLAESFSSKMKLGRAVIFAEKDNQSELPAPDGEYHTYCRLDDVSCVFMVHVPSLRKYKVEDRSAIADLAWRVAHGILANHGFAEGKTLAVGTRGRVAYHRIDLGKMVSKFDSLNNNGIEKSGTDSTLLESFFPSSNDQSLDETSGLMPILRP